MNKYEYDAFRTAIEDAFVSLYAIDVASLTPAQRSQHQAVLNATYLAILKLGNQKFSSLTAQATQQLNGLANSAFLLQQQLAGFKEAVEIIEIVTDSFSLLTDIVNLLT